MAGSGPDPESRDSGFDAHASPRNDGVISPKSVDGRDGPGHDGSRRVAGAAPVAYLLAMTAAAQKAQEKPGQSTPSVASAHDKILIVDFGSQVTQLIARR